MARITYTNKTTAATSPLPATQKLTSGDANEIKASVNAAYDQIEEVAGEVAARPKYLEMRVELSSLGDANPIIDGGYNELSSGYAVTGLGTGDYRITFDDPVLPQYLTEPEAFSVDPSTPFYVTAIWSSTTRVDIKAWNNLSQPAHPSNVTVVIRVKQ